jgi:hypothetical protein
MSLTNPTQQAKNQEGSSRRSQKETKQMAPERIYDALLAARTADTATITFKDGRVVTGALIFNPFKGTGRVIDPVKEASINFDVKDIRDLKF